MHGHFAAFLHFKQKAFATFSEILKTCEALCIHAVASLRGLSFCAIFSFERQESKFLTKTVKAACCIISVCRRLRTRHRYKCRFLYFLAKKAWP